MRRSVKKKNQFLVVPHITRDLVTCTEAEDDTLPLWALGAGESDTLLETMVWVWVAKLNKRTSCLRGDSSGSQSQITQWRRRRKLNQKAFTEERGRETKVKLHFCLLFYLWSQNNQIRSQSNQIRFLKHGNFVLSTIKMWLIIIFSLIVLIKRNYLFNIY